MAFASAIKYYASNTNDAIDKIKDTMVSAGWSVHDDLSGGSPYGYVMTSSGTLSTDWPAYTYIYNTSNFIYNINYLYWDNVAHTGNVRIASSTYAKTSGSSGSFYIWVAATEENMAFCTYVSSVMQASWLGLANPIHSDPPIGVLQSGVSAGSDVTLTLDTGEANRFIVGNDYQILDSTSREVTTVTAKDTVSGTITVDSLSYDCDADGRIGMFPYRWCLWNVSNGYSWPLNWDLEGTTDGSLYWQGVLEYSMFSTNYVDPDARSQMYIMWPVIFGEYPGTYAGYAGSMPINDNTILLRARITTDKELPLAVGHIDDGTSSGSNTSSTLNDTSKSWTTNEHANKALLLMAGLGSGQLRTITSNTSTQLTITPSFDTTPDGSSDYVIAEQAWVYLYVANSANYSVAMRML
jgi:hypothetical protein